MTTRNHGEGGGCNTIVVMGRREPLVLDCLWLAPLPPFINIKAMDNKDKKERPVNVHITNHNKFEKGVGAFITNLNHLTLVMDGEGNMKMDLGSSLPVTPLTSIDTIQGGSAANNHDEEFFRFIHPEIGDDEAWRIHQAVKRLVTTQKVAEICSYLHELKKTGKVLLPQNPRVMYEELKKLGMPDGDGYTFGHFRNKYLK